jgi:hypothetical protein
MYPEDLAGGWEVLQQTMKNAIALQQESMRAEYERERELSRGMERQDRQCLRECEGLKAPLPR